MRLKDKVAVVTGGNDGIGRAIAEELKAEGAKLVIFGRNRKTLDETQERLGPETLVVQGDISKMADLDRLYESTAERFGKIDVLVANAGISPLAPIDKVDEAHFDTLVNTNFKGTYFTLQKALPLLTRGSSVILIGSTSQSMGIPATTVYAATKAALRSLARTASADLIEQGIRVNVVNPGPTLTPGVKRLFGRDEALPEPMRVIKRSIPMDRFGTPKETAAAVVFLASPESSFILGEEINVDGGWVNVWAANINRDIVNDGR